MGKKHKNKVRVLPGRMYRLVRSDRSVYRDAENALKTCFGAELISNAGNVVRFKNTGDLVKTLSFAKDVLRVTEALKNGNRD